MLARCFKLGARGTIIEPSPNSAFENNSIDTCKPRKLVFATQWKVRYLAVSCDFP